MPEATQIVERAMPGRCSFYILLGGDPICFRGEWSQESDDDYFNLSLRLTFFLSSLQYSGKISIWLAHYLDKLDLFS